MSTKTMRLPPRRVLTAEQPRRNGEQPATPRVRNRTSAQTGFPRAVAPTTVDAAELTRSNQILAGYLAYEFLTSSTLFGEPWKPRAPAAGAVTGESRKRDRAAEPKTSPPVEEKRRRYAEVCHLLKAGGTHLAGVVNPSQLAGILKLR
ncbi:PREDICTED: uncharacterized protein LOC104804040 [Tarenaya hassleriana]|uniref:uncharacterized protein LOC104804040 n=1 Tax=Tarenaya hassleriana TaxID=28532 RepID=UPI00053C2DF2|nr:PREDICTED: uncharacterized protein LOC104804040 [Tarenaya hassleriana]